MAPALRGRRQRVGAVWLAADVARRLGLVHALGTDVAGQFALWRVIARLLDQGSRLSAVRVAQAHAACDVLGIRRGFDENDLYDNLTWLSQHQEPIEQRLFAARRAQRKRTLFLYDVTSSYLEGEDNALGAYGYHRDGKKGKKQIVIGLLCDDEGVPVSTEVFRGNTQDPQTCGAQVRKASERVTFVGDRGTIKSGQIDELADAGFHYITTLTKPQIETMLSSGVLQLALFDDMLCSTTVTVDGGASCLRIPVPRETSRALLDAAAVRLPEVLPHVGARAVTHRSLPSRRQLS